MTEMTELETQLPAFFTALLPLIAEEWPEVKTDVLKADAGLGEIVAAIAEATDHSKVKVKRHLAELLEEAQKDAAPSAKAKVQAKAKALKDDVGEQLKVLVDKLEMRSDEVVRYAKEDALPNAEKKMKDNLLITVLVTLGVGFLVGLLVRGSRR